MSKAIALIDMDGTLCDLDGALQYYLEKIRAPGEPEGDEDSLWMEERRRLIKSLPGFWRNLKPLDDGFQVLRVLSNIGFSFNVLTKGPTRLTSAWSEKVQWCRDHLPSDVKVTITEDKGLVYGRVLFDDFPPYIQCWLEWRPRGFVIMLDQPWNKDFEHPQVFRFRREKDLSAEDFRVQMLELTMLAKKAKER